MANGAPTLENYLTQEGRQLRRGMMQQYQTIAGQGPNPFLQQAGQQVASQRQPALWQTAQNVIQQQLAPGYTAFSPQESDAMYQAMQRRIQQTFDQRSRDMAESLNQRGMLRTGLYDALQQRLVEQPRSEALTQAAMDVYLRGQEATRQQQNLALQAALGLGGQQAAFGTQHLQNLLGVGQAFQAQQLLPLQLAMQMYSSVYGPEAAQNLESWFRQQGLDLQRQQFDFQRWLAQQNLDLQRQQYAQQQAQQSQALWGSILGNLLRGGIGWLAGGPMGAAYALGMGGIPNG